MASAPNTTRAVLGIVEPASGPVPPRPVAGPHIVGVVAEEAIQEPTDAASATADWASVTVEAIEQVVEHRETLLCGPGQHKTPAASIGRARV